MNTSDNLSGVMSDQVLDQRKFQLHVKEADDSFTKLAVVAIDHFTKNNGFEVDEITLIEGLDINKTYVMDDDIPTSCLKIHRLN